MWPVGHFALGYFSALAVNRFTKEKIFVPLVWFCAVLPDIDEFMGGFIEHRGPTHSIIIAVIFFLPIYIIFWKGLPYFAAVASHSLIGDLVEPYIQLFWPVSMKWYGLSRPFILTGAVEIYVEVILFALMLIVMLYRRKIVYL